MRSKAFFEHVNHLGALHSLMATNSEVDGTEDAIRDAMDATWHSMTTVEQAIVSKISEDLYRFHALAQQPLARPMRWGMDQFQARLRSEFPGKKIIALPEEEPTELVVETDKDERESWATALIARSAPHVHQHTTESYKVLNGTLRVSIDGETRLLQTGETLVIAPGQVHWAEGVYRPACVQVSASPPWSQDDHHVLA